MSKPVNCTHTFHRLGGIDDCPTCSPDKPFFTGEDLKRAFLVPLPRGFECMEQWEYAAHLANVQVAPLLERIEILKGELEESDRVLFLWKEENERLKAALDCEIPTLKDAFIRVVEQDARIARLEEALGCLYEETADYIRINNLGDAHHNRSMQLARTALEKK